MKKIKDETITSKKKGRQKRSKEGIQINQKRNKEIKKKLKKEIIPDRKNVKETEGKKQKRKD